MGGANAAVRQRIAAPTALPNAEIPVYGSLDFPTVIDDPGPPNGLTLDGSIERLVRENLYLKAAAFELPQAEADVLTASLRANPIFYADSQLIPYGQYSRARPGGQTQYDVNISYPLDVSRKRQARTTVAQRAKRVLEQQYRDAVRLQIDNLYTVYVDVLAARATLRYSEASVEGLDKILVPVRRKFELGGSNKPDYLRVTVLRETAENGRLDAETQLRKAKRSLANLLNIPPDQAESLDLQSPLRDTAPPAPPEETLIQNALASRPDLIAYRLGVLRAEADVTLAKRNRYQDVYVLMQPYTFQDNTPNGLKSATSWALGVTVPIPIYNRNQGNIMRAELNVGQTHTQLAGQIRQVITDVELADREYRVTRDAAERFSTILAPLAREILETAQRRYTLGEDSLIIFLYARNEYVSIVKQNLDTIIRHRRAMLDLNTAVGQRILP
ncbi:MAG: outer membrane protein [Planctomycetota bacterium]|nr:outer membrane protein [Planctomycetota bacterium]